MKGKVLSGINWLYLSGVILVAALANWHMGDVKKGVLESGDTWLVGHYRILAILAVLVTVLLGYLFFYLKNGKLEQIFPVAGLCLGMLYLAVLPPLSAPDEVSHYISAYKLSNQLMGKEAVEEHGLVYIRGEDAWIENVYGVEDEKNQKVIGQTLEEETYVMIHDKGLFGDGPEERVVSSQWTVRTTPMAYVPQAIGITLARLLHLGSMGLLYAGRLMNLLFYLGITYLAMKRLPFGREVLFGVALLPMTLHLTASMSYDAMILALTFYATSVCLDLAYKKEKVQKRDVAVLALVFALLGPCKIVYGVVMGLCLLIPVRKFGGWRNYILSAMVVLGAFALAMFLVNAQTITTYTTGTENYVAWAEEAGYSLRQLLSNRKLVRELFYNTMVWQAEHYHLTMIGAYLGNVDVVLDVPYLIVVFLSLSLLGLAFRKPGENLEMTRRQRIWIWLICLMLAVAVLFSMLLAWTPVSSKVISGVQGRYFLPLLPVLLMSIKNDFVVLSKNADKAILFLMCCANSYVLVRLFAIVCMRL